MNVSDDWIDVSTMQKAIDMLWIVKERKKYGLSMLEIRMLSVLDTPHLWSSRSR